MHIFATITLSLGAVLGCCSGDEPEPAWDGICTTWPDGTTHFYPEMGPYLVGLEIECPAGTSSPDPSFIHDANQPHGPAEAVPVCRVDGWC